MRRVQSTESYPRLVADVGGTHARFAMLPDAASAPQSVVRTRCNQFATLADALQHYLQGQAPLAPRACAIGVATAVTGDRVRLTNHPWDFSIRELQQSLGVERLLVINDFAALALSLPALLAAELRQIGGGTAVAGAALGLIGPGTGLGVAGLLPVPGGSGVVPIVGEGGHATIASFDAEEAAVLEHLQRRFGHVSAERVLSGPGLENLHRALCEIAGRTASEASAEQITQAALAGSDETCAKALTMFCGLLGSEAGNLALTLGARGGIYVGGGIVPRLGTWFDSSPFRARFEAKGRLRDYLRGIPAWVVLSEVSPALIGASRALDSMAG